ncbi:antibiotic biosynthesis monooxygenase family protein [Lysinibacillus xylanilyticus]|uniref:Antibiotic biosynthesis monooxygenase n=1 Tax=Lysinibacillus xylanilyticus TaxID=582475 RepID=A0ABT4ENB8_9BACI|nr:antibiotic biosynthesis monooxygenase [Lysinibacillus xylanilyticus]MCY9547147.1 antibiotic biosynthesis monooxygenase [Lysinibacillus xylanilyticus]
MKTYYAVIFTSKRTDEDGEGYAKMAEVMDELAQKQPGFIRVESARNAEGKGITVSYWESLEAIQAWRENSKHLVAQQFGKEKWYMQYNVEICKVIKDYSFIKN